MRDILTTRIIKFPYDKGPIMMRGGIITRDQMTNVESGMIRVDDVTFARARRMLNYANLTVCKEETSVDVRSGDENMLNFAYTDEPFTHHEDVVESINISEIEIPEEVIVEDTTDCDKEIDSDSEMPEEIEMPKDEEEIVDDHDEMINSEESHEAYESNSNIHRQATRIPQPNNHHNKKHRH